MCGIAVVLAPEPDTRQAVLRALLGALEHRGRPGTLYEQADLPELGICLGADRLPIVARSGNRQPARSPSGRYRIVLNGEIFNYQALLAQLRAAGAGPAQPEPGDTVVLAAAIEHWGLSKTLIRLVWEGAFVAIDTAEGRLLAARDHLGIKPLYYTRSAGLIAFASEIKALVPVGDAAIEPVPPGSHLTLDLRNLGEPQLERWWQASEDVIVTADADVVDATDVLLREAIRVRVPDKPYAVALSGGVDSSLVLRHAMRANDQVTAYVLARGSSTDLDCARRLCAELGVDLVEVAGSEPGTLRHRLADIVRIVETWEWQVVNHAAPMTALLDAIRSDGHDVVLTGEGADELFHGYTDPHAEIDGDALGAERLLRIESLHRTNCRRLDRMGMHYGLETRVPFLDRALTDFALGLPARVTLADGVNKYPIRQVAARVLPDWLARRPKLSFARGAGYEYAGGEVASVFGPTELCGQPQPLPDGWSGLARYRLEHVFLNHFLGQGYGRAGYLQSRSQ